MSARLLVLAALALPLGALGATGERPAEGAAFVGAGPAHDSTAWSVGWGGQAHAGYQWGLFGVEGRVALHPDTGLSDLTGLVSTLVQIAHTGPGASRFQQPVSKTPLLAGAALRMSPVGGTIQPLRAFEVDAAWNLLLGPAAVLTTEYYASYDPDGAATGDIVRLDEEGDEVHLGFTWGTSFDLALGSRVMLNLDVRRWSWLDQVPQYDPDVPVSDVGLFHVSTWSLGVSFTLGGE